MLRPQCGATALNQRLARRLQPKFDMFKMSDGGQHGATYRFPRVGLGLDLHAGSTAYLQDSGWSKVWLRLFPGSFLAGLFRLCPKALRAIILLLDQKELVSRLSETQTDLLAGSVVSPADPP